jgi:hypothetical protein
MLLDSKQCRVAAKALLNQCCTDKGLILWGLANTLDLVASTGDKRTFTTMAGTFSTKKILRLTEAMPPCLSTNRTFTLELMIVPRECSADLVILGQNTMRELNLDTSVRDNTISWGEEQISMVPHDYWMVDRIL